MCVLQFNVLEIMTVLQHKLSLGHDPKVVLNAVGYAMRASKYVLEEPYTGQHRELQSSPPGEEITPCHQYVLGADHLESTFAEEDAEVLVDKSKMSQQWAITEKRLTIMDCIRGSAASRLRRVFLVLYSALVGLHLECCV